MTFWKMRKSSSFEILPSPFLSTKATNYFTSSLETILVTFIQSKASVINVNTYSVSKVPLLSTSYASKTLSTAIFKSSSLLILNHYKYQRGKYGQFLDRFGDVSYILIGQLNCRMDSLLYLNRSVISFLMTVTNWLPLGMLLVLAFMITLGQGKIITMNSSITNPSMLSICEKSQSLIVAGGWKFQFYKKAEGKFTTQSYTITDAIIKIKCLKQGYIAVATKNQFCIYDINSVGAQKCKSFKGRPLSIAEQPESNLTYLLISENSLELNQIQTANYGVSFTKNQLSLPQERNIVIASYLANRQYIFVADEINQLSIYRSPFNHSSASTTQLEDFGQIREIKGMGSLNSALITDLSGNFMLIKGQEEVGSWKDTPYQRGCLCTKEQFVLVNRKKLALYDFQVVKMYDGYTVTDLVDIACVSDGETHNIYLLDGNGKVVTVNIESNQGGFFIYIVIAIAIIIVIAVAKFAWFAPKQALSSDQDDASKQDRQNAYRELKDYNIKDTIKENK